MSSNRTIANRLRAALLLAVVPALALAQAAADPEPQRPWTANLALILVFAIIVGFLGYVMSRRRSRGVTRANPRSRV